MKKMKVLAQLFKSLKIPYHGISFGRWGQSLWPFVQ